MPFLRTADTANHAAIHMLLMMCGVSMYNVVLTEFIAERECASNGIVGNTTACNLDKKSAREAASLSSIAQAASSAPALLFAGTFGALSDILGRRPFLIITVVGMLADSAIALGCCIFNFNLRWILLGRALYSLGGGLPVFLGQLFSFVADATPSSPDHSSDNNQLHSNFVRIEAVLYFGGVVAPLLGGALLQNFGFLVTFFIIVALHAINLTLFAVTKLIGSVEKPTLAEGNMPVGKSLKQSLLYFVNTNTLTALFQVVFSGLSPAFLTLCMFLFLVSVFGWFYLFVLYTRHIFSFSPELVGIFAATEGSFRTVNLVLFSLGTYSCIWNVLFRRNGEHGEIASAHLSNLNAVRLSLSLGGAGFCVYAFAETPVVLFLGTPLVGALMLAVPLIRSMFSVSVGAKDQGKVLSAIAALENTVGIVGPMLLGYIWETTLDNTMLIWMACLVAAAVVMTLFVKFDTSNGGLSPNLARAAAKDGCSCDSDRAEIASATPSQSFHQNNISSQVQDVGYGATEQTKSTTMADPLLRA